MFLNIEHQPGMSATEAQLGLEFQLELERALESEVEYGFEFAFEFECELKFDYGKPWPNLLELGPQLLPRK